jgi:hypothetical protein
MRGVETSLRREVPQAYVSHQTGGKDQLNRLPAVPFPPNRRKPSRGIAIATNGNILVMATAFSYG